MTDARDPRRVISLLEYGALLGGIASTAVAQQASQEPGANVARIDVTGSNITRSDSESISPLQVLTREDILHSGATTTSALLSKLSANLLGFNDQLSIGDTSRPGLASANLRGIGSGST